MRRYIVGRPNLLYIPVKLKINEKNMFLNKGSELIFKVKGVWVYSYNDDYPTAVEIDPEHLTPRVGYRLGEVGNQLPDGCELHPKYKNDLTSYVLQIKETKDYHLKKTLEVMEYYRKLKTGEYFDVDEKSFQDVEDGELPVKKKEKPKKEFKSKRKRPKSLKKMVAEMEIKVKEGVVPEGSVTVSGEGKKGKKKTEQ